jgi:O-Antigen ligase
MSTTPNALPGTTSIAFPPAVRWIAIGFLLLAALTVTWNGVKLPGAGNPADIFIVLSLAVSGLMIVFGGLRFSVPAWLFIPCIAIVVCVLVRLFDPPPYYTRVLRLQVQGYHPESLPKALFWLFALIIVPLAIVACTAIDRRSVVWTMGAFVTGVTISNAIAITDLTGVTPHIGHKVGTSGVDCPTNICFYIVSSRQMNGLTSHPNTLGLTAAISIPIVIYFMSTMRWKWVGAIALIVLFGGIIASGSRGAQAVAPLSALAAALWMPNKRSLMRLLSITVLGVVVAGILLFVSVPRDVRQGVFRLMQYRSQGNAESNAERLTVFRNSLADWQSYPIFGAGIRHIVEAHDIYLQLLAAGGIVLAMAMLIYWFCVLRDCWRLSNLGIAYARFLMISIGTWLALGIVENSIADRYLYFTIGCVAGLASANLTHGKDSSQPRDGAVKFEEIGGVAYARPR